MKKLFLIAALLLIAVAPSFSQKELKKTKSGIEYIERGNPLSIPIFWIHGQQDNKIDFSNTQKVGFNLLSYDYKTNTTTFADTSTHGARLISPIYPTVPPATKGIGPYTNEWFDKFFTEFGYKNDGVIIAHSRGGGGVLQYLSQPNPKFKFRAVIVFAPEDYAAVKSFPNLGIPIWFIHARYDDRVPYASTERYVKLLEQSGNTNVTVTTDPGKNHSIPAVYFMPGKLIVWDWLRSNLTVQEQPQPVSIFFLNGKFYIQSGDGLTLKELAVKEE